MDYGQFIAKILDGILISYESYGSYQGDYIAIIEKDHDWLIYKGGYGSCSGCDWLEGTRIFSEEDYDKYDSYDHEEELNKCEVLPKIKEKFLAENKPFLVLPKSQLPDTLEDFIALLPANTRIEFDEDVEFAGEDGVNYEKIFKQMKNFKFDNLLYLEEKHKKESV